MKASMTVDTCEGAYTLFRTDHSKICRAISTIRSEGVSCYANRYVNKWLCKAFMFTKSHQHINRPTWKKINFHALDINGDAQLLLNPSDEGFSKEFNVYGFREPLNTFALFCHVAKKKPAVLDIGGNLGYFALVELEAGARDVIAVEPIETTFKLLSQTLAGFKRAKFLNIAISDSEGPLKLYMATEQNVTSSSKTLIEKSGRVLKGDINVPAETLSQMVRQYSVTMLRMDVEGHEYRILGEKIPDSIDAISMELHILPPYSKDQATQLLENLQQQNFGFSVAVNEMPYGYYPIVEYAGLETAYKLVESLEGDALGSPHIQTNPSLGEVLERMPKVGCLHLLLER